MASAPRTPDENERLAELDRYAILATAPEPTFDRITRMAARIFHCPVALLSFVACDRQWFKSCVGFGFSETSRDVSFCAWAIRSDKVMVVPDATMDPRFCGNSLVTAENGIRFYAGAPIVSARGFSLGTVCIIDTKPRPGGLTTDEIAILADLAAIVAAEMEARVVTLETDRLKNLLQVTLSSIGDGVITADTDGRVMFLNRAAAELTGWTAEEAVGKPLSDVFVILQETTGRSVDNTVACAIQEARITGVANHTVLVTRHGREIPIDDSTAPIYQGGKIVGSALIFRDISLRRKAELLLELREEQFRNTFARAPLGMVLTDSEGTTVESNLAYRELTGYSDDELRSKDFITLTHPAEAANNSELFKRLALGEIPSYSLQKRIYRKDGHLRWVRAHAAPLHAAEGRPTRIIGIVEDITPRIEAEEKLSEISAKLQMAHDLMASGVGELRRSNEELSQFAHAASHDLRSPLKTVVMFAELLERGFRPQLGDEGAELLGYITRAARRMAALVSDLLDFASTQSTPIEYYPIDANEILRTALENLRGSIVESSALVTSDRLPMLRMSETQLRQLFQNLIGNAIAYRSAEAPVIHISVTEREEERVISCQDNGMGIESKYHERIFEPFKRLHGDELPGSGIGLAVCKRIVERYRGRLWVESSAGKGSIFHVALPK